MSTYYYSHFTGRKWNPEVDQGHTAAKQWHSPGPPDHLQCHMWLLQIPSASPQVSEGTALWLYPLFRLLAWAWSSRPLIVYCKPGLPSSLKQGLDHIPSLCSYSRMPILSLASLFQPWNNSRTSFPCPCHSEERSSDNSTGWFHTSFLISKFSLLNIPNKRQRQ